MSDGCAHLVAADGWAKRTADGHIILDVHLHLQTIDPGEVIKDLIMELLDMASSSNLKNVNHTCNLAKVIADVHDGLADSHARDQLDLAAKVREKTPFGQHYQSLETLGDSTSYTCHLESSPKAQCESSVKHYALSVNQPPLGEDPRQVFADLIELQQV